jgi:FG-GAP-like repeat
MLADVQPDGEGATPEVGVDRPDINDTAEVGGGPIACTLVLGMLPLVHLSDYFSESMAIADLNGDGKLDVVGAGDGVSVLLGQGDGRFPTKTDYATGIYRAAIAVSYFHGDGKPDVAVANAGTATAWKRGRNFRDTGGVRLWVRPQFDCPR